MEEVAIKEAAKHRAIEDAAKRTAERDATEKAKEEERRAAELEHQRLFSLLIAAYQEALLPANTTSPTGTTAKR